MRKADLNELTNQPISSSVQPEKNYLLTYNKPKRFTTTVLRPFFRDNPGEPVPEEKF